MLDAATQRRLTTTDPRIHLTETQTQCGPDVAIVDFAWEKRALMGSALTPRVQRGRSAFLFSGLGQGLAGPWRLSAYTGDNLFLGGGGAAGIVRVNPASASYSGVPGGCVVTATVTASYTGISPPSGTATVTSGGACSITPVTFACTLTGTGFVPTSVSTTVAPTCMATTMFTPVPASGPVFFNVAGATVNVSGPPGATVPVSVPYTVTATPNPTMVGPWSVTSTGSGACTTSVTLLTSPLSCSPSPGSVSAVIEVFDPDLFGPSVSLQVTASNGDAEPFTLLRIDAGRYRLARVPVLRGVAMVTPGNGQIDLPGATPGVVTLTFSYLDAEPGGGGSPVVRTATLTLNP